MFDGTLHLFTLLEWLDSLGWRNNCGLLETFALQSTPATLWEVALGAPPVAFVLGMTRGAAMRSWAPCSFRSKRCWIFQKASQMLVIVSKLAAFHVHLVGILYIHLHTYVHMIYICVYDIHMCVYMIYIYMDQITSLAYFNGYRSPQENTHQNQHRPGTPCTKMAKP